MAALLPPSLEPLLERVRPDRKPQHWPPLRPTKLFDAELTSQIDSFVQAQNGGASTRLALHLLNDDIDRAHKIAQDNEGDMTSDLCHAVLHRREGEYWNSKLWYDLIKHPLIEQVYGSTEQARSFVDAVEALVTNKTGASTACAAGNVEKLKQKQAEEMAALVHFALQGK